MNGYEMLAKVWEHAALSYPGDVYTARISHTTTVKEFKQSWNVMPYNQPPGCDVYFAPGRFNGDRLNKNLMSWNLLWADLDDKFDPVQLKVTPPTFMWETSPGMFQAIWLLHDSFKSYEEWASANKQLTYRLKADKGGWHGAKLLRIPGTLNWKRADEQGVPPQGGPVKYDPHRWYTVDFPFFVSKGHEAHDEVLNKAIHPPTSDDAIMVLWSELPMGIKAQLEQRNVPDRSLHMFRTLVALNKAGFNPQEALDLVWKRSWNKYITRPSVLIDLIRDIWS